MQQKRLTLDRDLKEKYHLQCREYYQNELLEIFFALQIFQFIKRPWTNSKAVRCRK